MSRTLLTTEMHDPNDVFTSPSSIELCKTQGFYGFTAFSQNSFQSNAIYLLCNNLLCEHLYVRAILYETDILFRISNRSPDHKRLQMQTLAMRVPSFDVACSKFPQVNKQ